MANRKSLFFLTFLLFSSLMFFSCSKSNQNEAAILQDWQQIEKDYYHENSDGFYKSIRRLQKDFSDFNDTMQYTILEYSGTDLDNYEKYDFYQNLSQNIPKCIEKIQETEFNSQEMKDYLFKIRYYVLKMQEMNYKNSATSIKYFLFVLTALLAFLVFLTSLLYFVTRKYEKECEKLEDLDTYSQIMIDGIELERKRISKEIHDTVIQDIKVLQMENEAYETARFSESDLEHNNKIKLLTDSTMKQLRSICGNLTPQETKSSVITAISNLCHEFEQKNNIKLNLKVQENLYTGNFTVQKKLHIIRIVQEALSNIEMHSKAKTVSILIRNKETKNQNKTEKKLMIFIVDDGIGFDVGIRQKISNHFGLGNMTERANLIGAKIDIISEIGEGTEITLEIPLYE